MHAMTATTVPSEPEYIANSHRYTVRDGVVYEDGERLTMAAALRAAPPRSELRAWLRAQGAELRSSGTRGYEGARAGTTAVLLRLADEDAAELGRLAEEAGTSRVALVTGWIRAAKKK